jgi:hypothetical protein
LHGNYLVWTFLFSLTERSLATVVTDPYDYKQIGYEPLKLKSDIITVSHNTPGHNFISAVKGDSHLIDGPGEFEIGGVFITGIQTTAIPRRRPKNRVIPCSFSITTVINILHLGDVNRVPTQTEVEAIGPVHVALVPVGGGGSLTAIKATEVISLLEPNIVIPMHYGTPAFANTTAKLDPLSNF